MTTDKYIFEDGIVQPVYDLIEWAMWLETHERTVAVSTIGTVKISTVFLGLDHQWGEGPPKLFETMIFGEEVPELDQSQWRYSTVEQAQRGHAIVCEKVREFRPDADWTTQEYRTGVKIRFDM